MKKRNKIYFLKIIALSSLLFFCLFFFEAKTSKAALGTAACNAKGGSCDVTCISSDYESLGMCDYGVLNCCKKKLVDTSGADPDPAGKGNFAAGTCGSSGEGTCKFSVAIGGTICGDDKNIGQDICSWSYSCCVPKANVGVGGSGPTTANAGVGGSSPVTTNANVGTGSSNVGTGGTSAAARTGSTGGLVPCTDDCTLCHLVVGIKNIFDYLLYTVLAPLFILGIVVSGVLYMVSSGSKGLTEKAKTALTYSLTGFVIALTAWLMVNFVMLTLGFKNPIGGSWYNFTCDTSQSKTAASSTTGTTAAGTAATGTKASGNLDAKTQEVINNYNTMVGWSYGNRSVDGKSGDCWSTPSRAYELSGLPGLDNLKWQVWDGNKDSIMPGDVMWGFKDGKSIHSWLVLESGATSSAIPGKGIGVNNAGLSYNLSGKYDKIKIAHIADYIK